MLDRKLTLQQRVKQFRDRWPETEFSTYRLRQLFKHRKIRQRVCRVTVALKPWQLERQAETRLAAFD